MPIHIIETMAATRTAFHPESLDRLSFYSLKSIHVELCMRMEALSKDIPEDISSVNETLAQ